nr:uncharacterized protein LOC132780969 [Anolis sagrei ordinatus]
MSIHLEVGPDWARVRWEPPPALSACPGATKKYVLCRRKVGEAHTETTYYNTSASSREFTFQNLDPQTAYLAGVWASTGGEGGGCWPHVSFATTHPDSKPKALDLRFLSLGIFIAFLMAAGGFHFSQKRIKASLWPPLPDPSGAQAVKILPALGQGQMHLLPLLLPSESGDPSEPLLVVEEGEGGGEEGGPLEKVPPQEETLLPPTEVPPPPEYKSQGLLLLGPTEEEEEGPTHTGHEGPQADLG